MSLKRFFSEFKPFQQGIAKVLGHLEADIMEIIWKKEKVSVREVYEQLKLEREIAYTTVMTIMSRLAEKQILHKEKQGNAYLYHPAITKAEFTENMVVNVLDGLLEDYADTAFSHFLNKIDRKDEAKLKKMEELINQHKKQGDSDD